MKSPAALAFVLMLLGAATASAATAPVTLEPGSLSYKEAAAACHGALGTVTFTLGHTRVASLPGVSEQVDTSATGIDTITLTDNKTGATATVVANGHSRTVTAKNVQVKWNHQLACVMPG
jgi:hypothetical protein